MTFLMGLPIKLFSFLASMFFCFYETATASEPTSKLVDSVRMEIRHAWNGYKRYAWGHDALKPLSKTPHDWYGESLMMTPVDAYDLLVIAGLKEEAAEVKRLILDSLSFDKNVEVQSFEVTIRLLAGLLSAYQIDGDKKFLELADDLGKRLLPVFNSKTGMPYRYVHLQTGKIRDSLNNPAEIGTALLEFGTLSKLTGNPIYYDKAKRAITELYKRRSAIGLVGERINVETGQWTEKTSHISGGIDSYYEYLLKGWLLFGDRDCKEMWEVSIGAVQKYLVDTVRGEVWYGQADMETGKRTGTSFGSLDAFLPAVLCLDGRIAAAEQLQKSAFEMWNLHGIEPEQLDYSTMTATAKQYYLRPEIIESAYYLFMYTKESQYQRMGRVFFENLIRYCRTDVAYAYLKDVITKEKADGMESFFFAETLKYLYLLFDQAESVRLGDIIFTTEAHPIRRTWKD